jgi:Domain of unknown function (DUF2357)
MTTPVRRAAPAVMIIGSVTHVARELSRAPDIDGYLSTPLLISDIAGYAASTSLDDAMTKYLPALSAVCARPHDRLAVEHILVRASQGRRVPTAGIVRLASHSEEWAGVQFGEVMPEKLLAQQYAEDFDFYENRIAAQLVDHLRRYLAQRIGDLNRLRRHLAALDHYERALHDGHQSHWARKRLANLLEEAAEAADGQSPSVANTLKQLSEWQATANRLRGTRVYLSANRRISIPVRLRRTNLLSRDRRYYETAQLWEEWGLRRSAESDTLQVQQRDFPGAYCAYLLAIAIRACAILGFTTTVGAAAPAPGGPSVEIRADVGARLWLECSADQDRGLIELSTAEGPVARIVVLPEDLTGGESPAETRQALEAVTRHAGNAVPTIIVYPGEAAERKELPPDLRRMAHWAGPFPPGSGVPRALLGVVPITPLELESTERLARALRWAWYPARALGSYRSAEQWDHSGAVIRQIATCPLSGQRELVSFEARDMNTFHCRCECGAQWGTRICGSCHETFPVLWAGSSVGSPSPGDEDPYATGDQVDVAFGSEILALPCPYFADWTRFRCPWCGICQGSPSCRCIPPSDPITV